MRYSATAGLLFFVEDRGRVFMVRTISELIGTLNAFIGLLGVVHYVIFSTCRILDGGIQYLLSPLCVYSLASLTQNPLTATPISGISVK